ncbi:TIGR04053 family radical SAM/SPASM domain-containing protein [Halorubellus sp. PRR65]|uniref:TIGR04053 family radical SAM/SPASM domain-containing protein n=1 Tax=Halorubellus sp. PRR65 TaxID=3098148 RepID=UPI002B25D1E6|nr:TIGR04053 family radical SAM/SPASM domain-containing protein [Halorubellus sp. PRR65]
MGPTAIDTTERPVVLVWEVTQACELACDHCRADATPTRHPDELSTSEGEALLDDAAAFGDGQLVVLSGGDPLARPDLDHLVSYGTERGLRMTLTPSGTDSLTADRVRALADAGLSRMALSLDGATPASHDAFRGETGSFEATLRAARYAEAAGVPLQINTTVCAETVDELPAIRRLVGALDAVMWSVFFLVPIGRGRRLDQLSPARAERTMRWIDDVREDASFAVKTTEAPQYRRVVAQQRRDAVDDPAAGDVDGGDGSDAGGGPPASVAGRRGGIRAGAGFAFVSHVGDVYPSGFLPESAGNVRTDSVVECYRESDLFESLRDPDGFRGKCGSCEYRRLCGGSRSRAYAATGDPLASDPLCPYVPADWDGAMPEPTGASGDTTVPGGTGTSGD